MEFEIAGVKYTIIRNVKEAFDVKLLEEYFTDYFHDFDYILGDFAYGKLRLKGFNSKENVNFKPYNDIYGFANGDEIIIVHLVVVILLFPK